MKKRRIGINNIATISVLVFLVVILTILSDSFLSQKNLVNVLQQVTVNAIVAVGMTVVILTGGIDLSVGSIIALSGMIMAKLMVDLEMHALPAMGVGLAVGALCGLANGFFIAKCKLQPMIATLGMMSIARGLALTIAQGRTVSGFSMTFRWIGNASLDLGFADIPVQIFLMILIYLLMFYFLRYRRFGRYLYSIGGNEEATRLSGISVDRYKMVAYIISGLASAVASIVMVAKLNSAIGTSGTGYELDAVAASVIGGVSLTGGFGTVWGTLLGAIIMGIIKNWLNLLSVSAYLQQVVTGVIIIVAVLADAFKIRAMKKRITE
jgi:ribose transport system permease protein